MLLLLQSHCMLLKARIFIKCIDTIWDCVRVYLPWICVACLLVCVCLIVRSCLVYHLTFSTFCVTCCLLIPIVMSPSVNAISHMSLSLKGYKQRWFRLKGNLLFYFRLDDEFQVSLWVFFPDLTNWTSLRRICVYKLSIFVVFAP